MDGSALWEPSLSCRSLFSGIVPGLGRCPETRKSLFKHSFESFEQHVREAFYGEFSGLDIDRSDNSIVEIQSVAVQKEKYLMRVGFVRIDFRYAESGRSNR